MIRGKILLYALVLTGVIAALLGIAQMWGGILSIAVFSKTLCSLLILGVLSSFLVAVDYDMPGSKGKTILALLVVLSIAASVLIISQMWWSIFAITTFGKILATLVIIAVLVSFIAAVKEDLGTGKKLKDEKYID